MIATTLAGLADMLDGDLVLDSSRRADDAVSGRVDTDSRIVQPGGIFFALHGDTADGHDFAHAAVANGAAVLVVDRRLEIDGGAGAGVAQIVVDDTLAGLARLARRVVASVREAGHLRVVAITGSNGKTTTKNMLRAILDRVGPTVAPQGSFNNHVGAPLSMLGVDESTRFLVVEMGAAGAGQIARLVDIATPDISVVLKVGLAHAGEFGGIEATARAKAEIVTSLPSTSVAILNADDDRVAAMADLTEARVVTFGLDDSADIRIGDVEATATGTVFAVTVEDRERTVSMRILGEHHAMNATAAFTVARELGLDLDDAIDAIESLERAERWRMELLRRPDGATIINDAYNASPDSTAAALKTLAQITRGGGRSTAILGEMAELGEFAREEHDRIGRLVVRLNIARLVVVGSAARIIHSAAGLEGSWDGESVNVETADEAFALVEPTLGEGDVVLVKSSKSAGLRFLGDRLAGVDG
ncbi:UDP-N-acetylmuramoyl-tripeptide--D-alanyl-D-alanine ligase [Marisediminicola sp. LYQ134]|uniref:UDP-N-acetylmuramoyl-tripeptide--D-alanyl-D- alanine ligase n=1 Tax=Marisediminicola sp. LYQ134 TaxID=3391061 RepID=UPI0039837304